MLYIDVYTQPDLESVVRHLEENGITIHSKSSFDSETGAFVGAEVSEDFLALMYESVPFEKLVTWGPRLRFYD